MNIGKQYIISYNVQDGTLKLLRNTEILFHELDMNTSIVMFQVAGIGGIDAKLKARIKTPSGQFIERDLKFVSENKGTKTFTVELPTSSVGDYTFEVHTKYSYQLITSDMMTYKVKENLK